MLRTSLVSAAGLVAGFAAFAQANGPALSIDAGANRRAISPDIYGINFHWDLSGGGDPQRAADIGATVRRWGGNSTSTYHWKLDVYNHDADWFYEVLPDTSVDASKLPEGSSFNQFADQARLTGGKIMTTVPLLGWLPKARAEMCSYNLAKYPNQCKVDPYAQYHPMTCGDGVVYTSECGNPSVNDGTYPSHPVYIRNDPNDAYAPADESLGAEWVRYAISRYGKAGQSGVAIWSLDNEPIWWDSTHRDVHPDPYTYDELLNLNIRYAAAIKQADPTALVAGPVSDNWASLWLSKRDIAAAWAIGRNYWANAVDRNAHGGTPLMTWYLQQMAAYERQHGVRLLDYLDHHAYIQPSAALRLDGTRRFWDPTCFVSDDYWIKDIERNGAPVAPALIPRLRQLIDDNYPGTKLALTEYAYGALDTLNGALAQADLLGIFGREGVDLATLWGPPKPTDPGAFAFRIYRNYDGLGGAFGETSVRATSTDQGQLSIYAALGAGLNLTALAINKTNQDLSSGLTLANFTPGAAAKVWRYSGARLDAIVAQPDVPTSGGGLTTVFPANSITLLVIPPASLPVPKPSVAAVTSAASYEATIAPGQMVVVWGTNLGPATLTPLAVDSNGLVSSSVAQVRVLFDGVPAPIVYVSERYCAAVVPYFGARKATTHVQVEVRGVRSDPLEIPIAPTAPGLFTMDYSGQGQGAITNEDGVTPNSTAAPARPGGVAILWGTGEGLTDPPGVDGRLAVEVWPKPLAQVTVEIGGLPATVEYAGAAPWNMPGLFQINARMAPNVAPGDRVPVRVKIGDQTSRSGVTLVVR